MISYSGQPTHLDSGQSKKLEKCFVIGVLFAVCDPQSFTSISICRSSWDHWSVAVLN